MESHANPQQNDAQSSQLEQPNPLDSKLEIPNPIKLSDEQILGQYKINEYLKELDRISKDCFRKSTKKPVELWKDAVKTYLKEIFDDICKQHKIDYKKYLNKYALCICGSLSKGQATLYSDLDCFIITADQDTKEALKPVVHDLDIIFQKIFEKRNQLCMDIIGINPKRFMGDPNELSEMISNGGVADSDSFYNSALSADYVIGYNSGLLKNFQQKLGQAYAKRQSPDPIDLAKRYYKEAITGYAGPRTKDHLNIKRDLFRPLDFILTALRMEAGIKPELDGSHLNSATLVEKLYQKGIVSIEIVYLVQDIYNKSMDLRFFEHAKAKQESDDKSLIPEVPKPQDNKEKQKVSDVSDLPPAKDSKQEEEYPDQAVSQMEISNNIPVEESQQPPTQEEVEELRSLLDGIAILRGIAEKRLALIESGKKENELPIFTISDILNPEYKDKSFEGRDMSFNPEHLLEQLISKTNQTSGKTTLYSKLAKALGHRKEFIKLVDQLPGIRDNHQPPFDRNLKDAITQLYTFLFRLPIVESQIATCEEYVRALIELINNQTVKSIYAYKKSLAKMQAIRPEMPPSNIVNIIATQAEAIWLPTRLARDDSPENQEIGKQVGQIKTRLDQRVEKDYTMLVQIMERFEVEESSETSNTNIRIIKDPLNLLQVVQGLNYLEEYSKLYPRKFFSQLGHSKQAIFSAHMQTMEQKLAVNGKEDAVAYLFEAYHQSLLSSPNSEGTRILGNALATTLGIKPVSNKSLDPYKFYTQIMRRISYPTDLSDEITSYSDKKLKSFAYKFFSGKDAKKKIEDSLSVLKNAADALLDHQPIPNFDFSENAWKAFEKHPMICAQWRALLLNELENSFFTLQDSYDKHHLVNNPFPNIHIAIESMAHLKNQLQDRAISNEDLALIIKAIKLANRITLNANPVGPETAEARTSLETLLPKIRNKFFLKPFVKHLKVFLDDQHPKAKILAKLDKKINKWHPWYKDKKAALVALRNDIANRTDNADFETVLDQWKIKPANNQTTNGVLMHKPRWTLFKKEDDPKLTATEDFLEKLKTKYRTVTFNKRG